MKSEKRHYPTKKSLRILLWLSPLLLFPAHSIAAEQQLRVSVSKARVKAGETIEVSVQSREDVGPVHARLLIPGGGARELVMFAVLDEPGQYAAGLELGVNATEGIYVVHAWTGEFAKPDAVGKATFLLGLIVNDFFIAPYLDENEPIKDLTDYLREFRLLGGNLLIAHNLITTKKAYYPSKIAKTDVATGSTRDLIELVLSHSDRLGIAVLLSVSWDMTRESPYQERMQEIKAITSELYGLYNHHPSLAGFYSYQEGSGTYFVPYAREFSRQVKTLDSGLLTACAPHVDDPLLAGYLSTIEELDVIIYQAGVMASYRTDNRKKYPFRRVKDFCALGAGAKRLQNKIAINHVELFGYLENRLTPNTTATTYENIYPQFLSAATVSGADGISFFTYHAHVYEPVKKLKEVERSRRAVHDGIKAFRLTASPLQSVRNPLTIYFPYSDWIIERWPEYFLPALDAFRLLGIPVDVLPYAPPLAESVYPYYPIHMNHDVLARLLDERSILVLPNVSGFQQTDSDLIKAFVEKGGVVVAFGPQLPMGRTYERKELFGVEERRTARSHRVVVVQESIGPRVRVGRRFVLTPFEMPVWNAAGARVIAHFEDGSPAMFVNKFGKGTVVGVLTDALTAARHLPELMRDVMAFAMTTAEHVPLVDIVGTNEQTDMSIARTDQGFRVAVINHNPKQMEVLLRPLVNVPTAAPVWLDLVSNSQTSASLRNGSLKISVPPLGFRLLEFAKNNSKQH